MTKGNVYGERGPRKLTVQPNGYVTVILRRPHGQPGSKYITRLVRRLVLEHYFRPAFEDETANHKDGNKQNNCLNNLEWLTQKENNLHAKVTGLNRCHDETHHNAKWKDSEVVEMRMLADAGWTQKQICERFSISQSHLSAILREAKRQNKYL